MKTVLPVLAASALLFSATTQAESLKIKPGMWESTVTTTNSFTGTSTQTETECVVDEAFDPRTMFKDAEGCEVVDDTLEGNTLTFNLACSIEGTQATIEGVYTTDGDVGSGTMNMEMSFGGQSMTMESSFEAKRLGDC